MKAKVEVRISCKLSDEEIRLIIEGLDRIRDNGLAMSLSSQFQHMISNPLEYTNDNYRAIR